MLEGILLRSNTAADAHLSPDHPFDIRQALDEVGIVFGCPALAEARFPGDDDDSPFRHLALVSQIRAGPYKGFWLLAFRHPDALDDVKVAARVFRSSYEAVEAIGSYLPQSLIKVKIPQ